jgi:hypothetical protein
MSFLRKKVPACVMLIVVVLAGLTGAMVASTAVTIQSRSVTTINGEVFTITGELTVSGFNTSIAYATASAAGTSGSPVAMTSGGSAANTAITMGNYTYSVTVTIASSHVSQGYAVTLKQDGISQGIVYIAQDAAGTVGYKVIVTWDLGKSLASAVYEVYIVPVAV